MANKVYPLVWGLQAGISKLVRKENATGAELSDINHSQRDAGAAAITFDCAGHLSND